jgi:phosphoribosylglycinamide formyltransferase 1
MVMEKKRVAILISGRGSNMAALIEATKASEYPAEIALVLSSVPEARGLTIAREQGVATQAINHRVFEHRTAFDSVVDIALTTRNIDIVCLAGFMRIFTEAFVEKWRGRMINTHPALLPSFKGTRVHEQVLAAGVAISGATVHFVIPALDSGPIIGQAGVPVRADDTPQSLEARVLKAEHKLYPMCLKLVCEEKAALDRDRTRFTATEPIALWLGS